MASNRVCAVLATVAMALGSTPAVLAQNDGAPQGHLYSPPYMPQGHTYAPGEESLPPVNSSQSQFETQVDILQTEIYRRNYEQSMFESEMSRNDLGVGPLLGPRY